MVCAFMVKIQLLNYCAVLFLSIIIIILFAEESAYKVLNNPQENGKSIAGIPLIIEAYNQHKDNADVVESICSLLLELSEYGEFNFHPATNCGPVQ